MQSYCQQRADAAGRASILVIEDEQAVRGLFRAILEPVGYAVVEAVDGQDGLRQFRQTPTDVVITDMYMLREEGWGVIRQLRADYPTLRIVAVTGSELPDEHSEVLRLGINAMLQKPLGVAELRNAVARCLLGEDGKSI